MRLLAPAAALLALLPGLAAAQEPSVADLAAGLASRSFREREDADAALRALGPDHADSLREAWAAAAGDPEARSRLERILRDWGRIPDAATETRLREIATGLRSAERETRVAALRALAGEGEDGFMVVRECVQTEPPVVTVESAPVVVEPGTEVIARVALRNAGAEGGWVSMTGYDPASSTTPFASSPLRHHRGGRHSCSGGEVHFVGPWHQQLAGCMRDTRWLEPGGVWEISRQEPSRCTIIGRHSIGWDDVGSVHARSWRTSFGEVSLRAAAPAAPRQPITCVPMGGRAWGAVTLQAALAPPATDGGTPGVVLQIANGGTAAAEINSISRDRSPAWFVAIPEDGGEPRHGSVYRDEPAPETPEGEPVLPVGTSGAGGAVSFDPFRLEPGASVEIPVVIPGGLPPGRCRLVLGLYPRGNLSIYGHMPPDNTPVLCAPAIPVGGE